MINLDMLGTAEHGFYAYSSSNEDLDRIVRALQGELLPVQPQITVDEPYSSDHRAFYDQEIPSILFTTGRYPEHGTGRDSYDIVDFDGMEKELEYIYNYTMSLCNGPRPLFRQDSTKNPTPASDAISWSDCDVKPVFLTSSDPSFFLEKWVYQYRMVEDSYATVPISLPDSLWRTPADHRDMMATYRKIYEENHYAGGDRPY